MLTYKDTGCKLHPSCLECPRTRCILDEPGGEKVIHHNSKKSARLERNNRIVEMRDQGYTLDMIADEFGITRGAVIYVLQKEQKSREA
jgi:hypothetical protein